MYWAREVKIEKEGKIGVEQVGGKGSVTVVREKVEPWDECGKLRFSWYRGFLSLLPPEMGQGKSKSLDPGAADCVKNSQESGVSGNRKEVSQEGSIPQDGSLG